MATTPAFDKAYARLNPRQKQAVDAIEGPVMVVAGPGTGKTQILTLRIANIVKQTDTPPEAVLALTFTESGAQAMRKRLLEIMGSPGYRVRVHTFHGFCNDVINTYPEEFPYILGSVPITAVDQILLMEEIIKNAKLERLKPYGDTFYYLRPALKAISELKRENQSPDVFEARVFESGKNFASRDDVYHVKGPHKGKMKGEAQDELKQIEKNKELVILYRAYQEGLRDRKWYDYEDMIMEVLRALESNPDLLLRLQETHHYLLADEHQDANSAQNRLLELLSNFHDNPNLFIVGDEKQAIFRFQGGSLENFLYFKRLYPKAVQINLEENYRSSQFILDSAHSLILKAPGDTSLRVRLHARRGFLDEPIQLVSVHNSHEEACYIAKKIQEKLKEGVSPREIAVLYRDNKDAGTFSDVFSRLRIPFVVESDENIFRDPFFQKLILLLRAVGRYGDEEILAEFLHLDFLGLRELDIFRFLSFVRRERRGLLFALASQDDLHAAGITEAEKFLELGEFLGKAHKASRNKNVLEVMEEAIEGAGVLAHIVSRGGALDDLLKISALFREAEMFVETHRTHRLKDFLGHLDLLEEHNVSVKKPREGEVLGVRLMTAHRSKGLEFEYVYVAGVYDGHWGNRRSAEVFSLPFGAAAESDTKNDDERRLLYVALTRAQKALTLTYPRMGHDGREQLPSQFIEEIDPQFVVSSEEPAPEATEENHLRRFIPRALPDTAGSKEFLNALFLDQGLSVTALNNYLNCPWNYFYSNLIRIPKAQDKFALYGTAVHSALKEFFDLWAKGEDMGPEQLISRFEHHLRLKPLSERDLEESIARGTKSLRGYYDAYHAEWNRRVQNEFVIKGILFDEKIPLRGALDKVEFLDGISVNVVDYKTSKPKTRNEIMGKTKTSTGDQFRQLVFYKLLLDTYDPKKFSMVSGEIDFIEPDEKGRYHKEKFDVTKDDVTELENTIRRVASEILELSFWETRCGDRECRYCKLREMAR